MSRSEKVIRYLWRGDLTLRVLKRWLAACVFEIILALIFDVIEAYVLGIVAIILALLSYWYLQDKDRKASTGKGT
jgi:hypothetical protein